MCCVGPPCFLSLTPPPPRPPPPSDLSELSLDDTASISFPDGRDKPMRFELALRPRDGPYRGGRFVFSVVVAGGYPHEAPKVKCRTKVFHPNIDTDGNVCLNILREDWKPVLSVTSILHGLQFLLADPNPDDPLNKDAASMMAASPRQFEAAVATAIARGGQIGGHYFPPCRA